MYSSAFVNDAPAVLGFLTNGDYAAGGYGDWAGGFGQLSVFFNNQTQPSLVVPLNLDNTLQLDNGFVSNRAANDLAVEISPCNARVVCCACRRAYVGFTASTGDSVWQVHDLLSWHFTQNREDWVALRQSTPRTA